MSEPLACYREATWTHRRSFELHTDRIVVKMRSSHYHSDAVMRLGDFRPDPNTLRVRDNKLSMLAAMLFFAGVGATVIALNLEAYKLIEANVVFAVVCFGLGLFFVVLWFQRIEYTQFVSHAGVPTLDVARSGSERARYDDFVELLTVHIASSQRPGATHVP